MTRQERVTHYTHTSNTQKAEAARLSRQIYAIGTVRLLVFVAGVAAIYLFHKNLQLVAALAFTTLAALVALMKYSEKLQEEKRYAISLHKICEDELQAFQGDFSAFDGADEKIDPQHDFSFDLDIFGQKSVFQLINRTVLKTGKETLCRILQFPLLEKHEIQKRQEAIGELAREENFCLRFRTTGAVSDDVFGTENDVKQAFSSRPKLNNSTLWETLCVVVPAVYLIYGALVAAGTVSAAYFGLLYFATLTLSFVPIKAVRNIRSNFDKKTKILDTYAKLIQTVENQPSASPLLTDTKRLLGENNSASTSIKQLSAYCRNLDLSFTLALLLLQPFLLWNVRYALKIEKWMQLHSDDAEKWFAALAQYDALVSLATFAANNPDYVFPQIADNSFLLSAKNMGHPLIAREKCVRNHIEISRKPYFMIVTGANMAGKSTYLRTVGINLVLAGIGAPVYAEMFRFSPTRLLTNLRTADSLVNNESYFFAELKRLKMIIENLQSSDAGLFIILDEILKGTNSTDKQKGSFALMRRLVKLGGNGIIATHDLALGKLESEFPHEIENFFFDAHIEGDKLSFAYTLQRGIAETMNASFLMKKMGIV